MSTASPFASAQMAPFEEYSVAVKVDSGKVMNRSADRQVIWASVLRVDNASSIRLFFDHAILGEAPRDGQPTVLRITSMFDHGYQELTSEHLKQWKNSTAYFNGNVVLLEIESDAFASPSRVVARTVKAAPVRPADEGDANRSICGLTDDRVLSSDVRIGRTVPIGCTAWLIDDLNHCMLSAGHCGHSFGNDLVEFNVPMSAANGSWIHSHPNHQYIIDQSSIQFNNNGAGDDWQYFGCFPNPNTGLTAAQAQGDWFILDYTPPVPGGMDVRVTGYGTTTAPISPTWNKVQKTHAGPYTGYSAATKILTYAADTTGGNSGSPIIDETNGLAIGIHTHGGCGAVSGSNQGTALNRTSLLQALANPLGVCAPQPPSNDNCSGAMLVSSSPVAINTNNATDSGQVESCGSIFNDVWYRIIVSESSTISVSICDSDFFARVAIYGASCPSGNMKAIACGNVNCDTPLTANVAGGAYRIRVGATWDTEGMATMHYEVNPLFEPCDADIAPPGGDGVVSVADIVTVIVAYGSSGEGLLADISPKGGDGEVSAGDLVAAIYAFGMVCP